MNIRSVTGNIKDLAGVSIPNATFSLLPETYAFGTTSSEAIFGDQVTVLADSSGDVAFDLHEGKYIGRISTTQGPKTFRLVVDSEGPWTLGRLIDASIGEITPTLIQQAFDAADAAEASATLALSAYQGRQYATRAEFVADDTYAPDDGTVVTAGGLQYVREAGADVPSALAGWVPFGAIFAEHFGATGASDSQGWQAAFNYAESQGIPFVETNLSTIDLGVNVDARGVGIIAKGAVFTSSAGRIRNMGWTEGVYQFDGNLDRDLNKHVTPPSTIEPSGMKLVFNQGGFLHVLMQGGASNGGIYARMRTGNIAAPSLPGNSLNENWEGVRTGVIIAVQDAYAYKRHTSETGTWLDFNATQAAMSDSDQIAFNTATRRSQVIGNTATFDVNVGPDCAIDIAFLGTATSGNASVSINGGAAETVNVTNPTAALIVKRFQGRRGANTVVIEHLSGNNLYVIGCNFSHINDLDSNRDYDYVSVYTQSPAYVSNENAHDYAIRSAIDDLWGGSYHGGEVALITPEWRINGKAEDPTVAGFVKAGKTVSLFQRTRIDWSTESLELANSLIFGNSQIQQSVACTGSVTADTFHPGMSGTGSTYNTVLGAVFIDDVGDLPAGQQSIGRTTRVEQIHRGTGRRLICEFTPFDILNSPVYGGMTVAPVPGTYNKIYAAPVRNTVQVVENPSWTFTRTFC